MQNIKERQEFENYNKIKLLGEGSFGKAFLVERASDKLKCVMKQIDINKMSEQEKKETVQESKILEALSHPNIVKFIEVFKTKKGKLCIVMDFADGGDLSNRQKEQRGRFFSESQVLEWFTQICLGLKHIHDRKILHRDLKGQNIFLTKQGIVKIGDFGIAKVLATTMQNARTVVGTPYYLSPEIVQSKPYSFKSDIWSLGVVLYEMCALKPPFDAPSLHFLAMKIVRGAYNPLPSSYSSELKNLIGQLLNTNEKLRPDVNKILSMPIMQNRIKAFLTETIYHNEFSHTILHKQNVFDPNKQMQMKQLQNLQQQIAQNKGVTPQQQKPSGISGQPNNVVVPRYAPGGAAKQNPQQQILSQQQPPSSRQQPNRNMVSPGMAAAFGAAGGAKPVAQNQGPPQYGAAGYTPSNNRPNYHYQQPSEPKQQPAQQQQQQKPFQIVKQQDNSEAKKAQDQKDYQERMKMIDQKLKEKEQELKKIDDARKERDQKRQQYEKELLDKAQRNSKEQDKKQKEQDVEVQKRRMQEDQARKIQEAQVKRKEEIEKMRRDEVQRKQADEKKRKEQQAKAEDKGIQDRIQKNLQKQKEQENVDLGWIKKMTEDAQNKIMDIEKRIMQKDNGGQALPMNNFEPVAQKRANPPPKSANRVVQQQNKQQPVVSQQEIKKAMPTARQDSEDDNKEKKYRDYERKKAMEEAKKNWGKKKDFVQIVGIPDDMINDHHKDAIQQKKIEAKPIKAMAQSNQDWHKPKPMQEKKPDARVQEKSPSAPPKKKPVVESKYEDVKKEQLPLKKASPPKQQELPTQQQINDGAGDDDYTEIYQMYEEMLLLVRDDFNQAEEQKGDSEARDDGIDDDSDSEEGFNDERDSEWDKNNKANPVVKIIQEPKEEKNSPSTADKRFNHTLQTIQEESDAEGTFAGSRQQKHIASSPGNVQDIEVEQEDRDDIEDDSTDVSSLGINDKQQQPASNNKNNKLQDFTFANGAGNEDLLSQEISKFTSVEHLRDYLETEIGEEQIMKAYPILKEFGDNIFFQEKTDELTFLLKDILTIQQIKKYQAFFASLIFMELQAEKEGGGEEGITIAMKTLKNINTTATFGKFF